MALQTGQSGNNNNQDQNTTTMSDALGSNAAPSAGVQQETQRKGAGFSFSNLATLGRSALSRNPNGESLTRIHDKLAEILKGVNPTFQISLHPLDHTSRAGLGVSVLVVAAIDKQFTKSGVAFHGLIIEGSREHIPSQSVQTNNPMTGQSATVMLDRVAGDTYDPIMVRTVLDYLGSIHPGMPLLSAEFCVVPRDINLEDPAVMARLAFNATQAVAFELDQRAPGYQDINLREAARDSMLQVSMEFKNVQAPDASDIFGAPVISTACVRLDSVKNISQSNLAAKQPSLNESLSNDHPVSTIHGFVDMVWDPIGNPQQNAFMPVQVQPNQFTRYRARYVMTALETHSLTTIRAQLLAIFTAQRMSEGNSWIRAFAPTYLNRNNERDMHDIGAINYEVNFMGEASGIGQMLDTKAEAFRAQFPQMMAAAFHPGMILSMDIDECGPLTWVTSIFRSAAAGNENANAAIKNAANAMTDGAFGRYFPQGARVMVPGGVRVHQGYYTDAAGQKRDLRHIDYLWILNQYGDKDPAIVREWSDSWVLMNQPEEFRMAIRKKIMERSVTDLTVNGFSCRVTFSTEFLTALVRAIMDCGLPFRDNNVNLEGVAQVRATADYLSSGFISPNASGAFQTGFNSSSSNYGNFAHNVSRW